LCPPARPQAPAFSTMNYSPATAGVQRRTEDHPQPGVGTANGYHVLSLRTRSSTVAIVQQPLTLDEFLELPERKPALEFADGVVTQKMAPKARHSRLQYKLAEFINRFAEPRRLAVALPELRTTFAGASVVPDVAVYCWDRIPRDAAGVLADDCREPPDIAVEIVSPRQSVTALVRRCLWYVEHGVRLTLLVDPQDCSIVVFRPGVPARAARGTDRIDLGEVIPDLELVVQELFDSLIMQ
jgi:Uma2 family endonuclease